MTWSWEGMDCSPHFLATITSQASDRGTFTKSINSFPRHTRNRLPRRAAGTCFPAARRSLGQNRRKEFIALSRVRTALGNVDGAGIDAQSFELERRRK